MGPDGIETAEVGAVCTAGRLLEDLPETVRQLNEMINQKIVPKGPIQIIIKAKGPHRAIKGKRGNVLEAGYDEDGETWLEVSQ